MDCFDDNLAGAFVDGTLDARRRGEAEDHLDTCRTCRLLLSEIGRALVHLSPSARGNGAPPPDPRLIEPGEVAAPEPDEAHVPLSAGMLVGRYIVVSLVGRGGMGEVYAAFDPKLERRVALKLIRHEHAGGDSATRMLREARALAQLTHPNIVGVFDVGSVNDGIFIAMELLEEGSLAAWRGADEPSPSRRLALVTLAGRGLAAAHAAGLVHRDVKPENVLLGGDGRCCIADFGLVEDPTSKGEDRRGVLAGTPAYMAPECRRGEPADARSDQFSFAVMARELVFDARPVEARLDRARRALERAVSAEPSARFPSMNALLRELEPARRIPVIPVVIGALVLAALVASGYRAGARARPELCGGVETPFTEIWNGERAARVRDAFRATRRPYADRAADGVIASLDVQARTWGNAKRASCEATRMTGTQSDVMYELRNRCFGRRLRDVEALVAVLTTAEPQTVDEATSSVDALASASVCDAATALEEPARNATPAITSAERSLATAAALARAGQPKKALAATRASSEEARATGDRSLLAEALTTQGEVELGVVQLGPATKTLQEAILHAEASRGEARLVRALTVLARVQMLKPELAHARESLDRANAVLERMPRAASELRDEWTSVNVYHLVGIGHAAEAVVAGRRHVADLEARIGPDAPTTTSARVRLAQALGYSGAIAEARDVERRVLAAQLAAFGPDHPKTAAAHRRLGEALSALEVWDEATAHAREALRIETAIFGESNTHVVSSLLLLGTVLAHVGDPGGAELLSRGRAIEEKTFGPAHPSVALALMADVERRLEHGDARGAEPLAERALAIWRATVGEDHFETIATSVLVGRARVDLGHDAEPLLRAALGWFDTHPARPKDVGDTLFALARTVARRSPRSPEVDDLLTRARARFTDAGATSRLQALDTWKPHP